MASRKTVERRVRVEFVLKEEGPIVRESTVGERITDAVFGAVSDYMLDVHDTRLMRSDTPKALLEHVDYAVVCDATTGEELYRTPVRGFPVKRKFGNDFDTLEAIRNTTDPRELLRAFLDHEDMLCGDSYYREFQEALFTQARKLTGEKVEERNETHDEWEARVTR